MRKIKKRICWDASGVSEVVGTILILAITVTLFSGVVAWIGSLPTPKGTNAVDMDAVVVPIGGDWSNGAEILITHKGGDQLDQDECYLSITIGTTDYKFKDWDADEGGVSHLGNPAGLDAKTEGYDEIYDDGDWQTNEVWYLNDTSIRQDTYIYIMVVNTYVNRIIWTSTLQGGAEDYGPIIMNKWTDSDPSTPTHDQVYVGNDFGLFVKVVDSDGDLNTNSVKVTFTGEIKADLDPDTVTLYDDGTTAGDQVAGDGIFSLYAPDTSNFFTNAKETWDGDILIFEASDTAGHITKSKMVLSVTQAPEGTTQTVQAPPSDGGGYNGGPGNLLYNGQQGFNIFNATEWDANNWSANDTRTFTVEEEMVIVIGSWSMQNMGVKNSVMLYDPFSALPPDPVITTTPKVVSEVSLPSTSAAFSRLTYYNGFTVYIYRYNISHYQSQFSDTGSPYFYANYPLEIHCIETSDWGGEQFYTKDAITITDPDGNYREYPDIRTYSDAAYNTETNYFKSIDMVYVEVLVQDVNIAALQMGAVRITDLNGNSQFVKTHTSGRFANPPWLPNDVSEVNNPSAPDFYRFAMDLMYADGAPYQPGNQTYALSIASVEDDNEEYTLVLSKQIKIDAPLGNLDLVGGFQPSEHPTFADYRYLYHFENNNVWTAKYLERVQTSAAAKPPWESFPAAEFADMDGDGDADVIAGAEEDATGPGGTNQLRYYRNNNDGTFENGATIENNIFPTYIKAGDCNKDGLNDFAISAGGQVYYYATDGFWDKEFVGPGTCFAFGDIDGDKDEDLVVGGTNTLGYYKYPSWTFVAISATTTEDVELADLDNDDDLDVIAGQNPITLYFNDGSGTFGGGSSKVGDSFPNGEVTTEGTVTNTYTNVDDLGDGLYELIKEVSLSPGAVDTEENATSETTGQGTRFGDYTDTWSDNNVYERLDEEAGLGGGTTDRANNDYQDPDWADGTVISGTRANVNDGDNDVYYQIQEDAQSGGPNEYSRMSWIFEVPVTGGSAVTFYVQAHHDPDAADGDAYTFEYSTTGADPWTNMVTIVKETDDGTYQQYTDATLNAFSGTLYIRVRDTDQTLGNNNVFSSIYIDDMYVISGTGDTASRLNHTWTFSVTGGTTVTFYLQAYKQDQGDLENFRFYYSTNPNSGYIEMLTVSKTADDGTYQTYNLPNTLSGTVYIRAMDDDWTTSKKAAEQLYVDHMYIHSVSTGSPYNSLAHYWNITGIAGDNVELTVTAGEDDAGEDFRIQYSVNSNTGPWTDVADISGATQTTYLFSDATLDAVTAVDTVYVRIRDLSDADSAAGDQGTVTVDSVYLTAYNVAAGGTALSTGKWVEVADADSDGWIDIFGTDGTAVYVWRNALGSWSNGQGPDATAATITISYVNCFVAGDIDGDGYGDFALGSSDTIYWYKNSRTMTWTQYFIYAEPGGGPVTSIALEKIETL